MGHRPDQQSHHADLQGQLAQSDQGYRDKRHEPGTKGNQGHAYVRLAALVNRLAPLAHNDAQAALQVHEMYMEV